MNQKLTLQRLQDVLERVTDLKVAVIGDFILQQTLTVDRTQRLSTPDSEKPAHRITEVIHSLAGAAAVASILHDLGIRQVSTFGVIGSDGNGWQLMKLLQKCVGDLSEMQVIENWVTPTYVVPAYVVPAHSPAASGGAASGGAASEGSASGGSASGGSASAKLAGVTGGATASDEDRLRQDPGQSKRPELKIKERFEIRTQHRLGESRTSALMEKVSKALHSFDLVIVVDQFPEAEVGYFSTHARQVLSTLADQQRDSVFYLDSRYFMHSYSHMVTKVSANDLLSSHDGDSKPNAPAQLSGGKLTMPATAASVDPAGKTSGPSTDRIHGGNQGAADKSDRSAAGEAANAKLYVYEEIQGAAIKLRRQMLKPVMVELGAQGILNCDGATSVIPALPVKPPVDQTGVPPCITAVASAAMAAGGSSVEACQMAMLAANLVLHQAAGTPSISPAKLIQRFQAINQ